MWKKLLSPSLKKFQAPQNKLKHKDLGDYNPMGLYHRIIPLNFERAIGMVTSPVVLYFTSKQGEASLGMMLLEEHPYTPVKFIRNNLHKSISRARLDLIHRKTS